MHNPYDLICLYATCKHTYKVSSMKPLRTIILLSLLFLAVSLCLSKQVHAASPKFSWSSSLVFGLPAYGTTVGFNDTVYFDSLTWDSMNASQFILTNAFTTGSSIASFLASATTSITITSFMISNKLIFTTTGAGTIILGLPSVPVSMDFNGAAQGSPAYADGKATITTLAPVQVTLDWTATGGGGGGGGGGGTWVVPPTVPNPFEPSEGGAPQVAQAPSSTVSIVAIGLLTGAGVLIFAGEDKRRRKFSGARKKWSKRKKKSVGWDHPDNWS